MLADIFEQVQNEQTVLGNILQVWANFTALLANNVGTVCAGFNLFFKQKTCL